jgi:hypothetical protein
VRIARILAVYYLVFLPSQFVLGFVEGAAHGWWKVTLADLGDQFGGWVVYVGLWMALAGLLVVPLTHFLDGLFFIKLSTRRRQLANIIAAPLAVELCGAIISIVSSGNLTIALRVFWVLPLSFLTSCVLFAILAHTWARQGAKLPGTAAYQH